MSEPLSADALRAWLGGGAKTAPAPVADTKPDLVQETLERYRSAPVKPAGKPAFRRGGDAAEASAPAAPAPKSTRRTNKYGAKCILCAQWVSAEQGYLAKDDDGKWAAEHLPGGCYEGGHLGDPRDGDHIDPEVQAVAASEVEVPPGFVKITAVTGQTYIGLQPGIYTLPTSDGHRTFRVRVQSTDDDFAPGKTILEYLTGPNNERDYTGFGFLNGTRLAVWKKHQTHEALIADARTFLADPTKAVLAARCIRCNKTLSTPESIAAMMGKDCRDKGW